MRLQLFIILKPYNGKVRGKLKKTLAKPVCKKHSDV